MDVLRGLCQTVVLFTGALVFGFGQLFAGVFSPGGTLVAVGSLIAGVLAGRPQSRRLVMAACAAGLAGAALHVHEYYSTAHFEGNYYAWFLTLPLAACLALIGLAVWWDGRGTVTDLQPHI